ncbi:LPS-assembly protein LptD [Paracoccus sp. M683]|uniref:LPS-assembly protein LptD n=1 Tax=Paracoccus sp. M683 TaxID=2594268 RepID=UPI00117F0CA3|nr:LPS assembly protein LptD [Paracoccus sp. M683]TRW98127.1 LPS-assembly protein LptD [Paracoccus sp. M683]
MKTGFAFAAVKARRAALAGAAGMALATALPLSLQAQDTGNLAGGPALAPTATMLDFNAMSDGTLASAAPETADPVANVTLNDAATTSGTTAEDAATVLADNIVLQGDRTLIAAGGVVIWYQGSRLVASRLVVDGASGDLTIEGPIHLTEPGKAGTEQEATLIADSAQLDRKLQDGIIRGARLVIARELQLAANELQRTGGGRMTRLTHVVASSCQVCAENPVPLWEIRARSITHDAEKRELTLENPQLRAFGLPVGGLPFTITAPDPTVDRRSGFLRPQLRTTSGLGFGIKVPYFITLGRSADLTLTPYLSASRTTTLEARYRQAFSNGALQLEGAISRDDLVPGDTRGYLFGAARFELPRGYRLGIQVQTASDRAYLLDYDITDADRLWSGVTLERVRRDKFVAARVGNYESLREDEDDAFSPAQVADAIWMRRITPGLIGGEALLEWSLHAHRRPSDQDVVGRDMARASVGLDWRRSQILPGGFVAAGLVGVQADFYRIAQDSGYDDYESRITPSIGAELRWPLMAHSAGATHIVEPVVQLLYSPNGDDDDIIPNEDSRLIEFDEGNLFDANRFPGWDAQETGLRANVGVSWTRLDPTGWSVGLTAGRVFRKDAVQAFGPDSPLTGRRSDWLVAAHYSAPNGLAVANRALFDDDFNFSRNELRLGWLRPDLQVSAGYLWIDRDRSESRRIDASELTGTVGWQIAPGLWGVAETRYDFVADRAQNAELGLTYRNECVTIDMGLQRRFSASDTQNAQTDFDLSVRLGGFGRQKDGPGTVARRSCMR